ncbi:hypothetical protein [Maritalea sp. S77]|uniref:hypothetical protein n=1 Tax=Maritalea sp. S77 TaxID=3415125 RepID=UPI003C7D8120
MKKLILPAVFFSVFSATSAFAACHEPVYPWPNDGSCTWDILCIFPRSGDMDIRDGVKMQNCMIEENASGATRSGPAKNEEECEMSINARFEYNPCMEYPE